MIGGGQQRRYTIAVDFDGVIHRYDTPWIDAVTIPDPPVEGAIEWLNAMRRKFEVVIFTTRAECRGGANAVKGWLIEHGLEVVGDGWGQVAVTAVKPAALVYIDDRAWRFEGPGTFPTADQIHGALPWHKRVEPEREDPICDLCGIPMRRAGLDRWICPRALTDERHWGSRRRSGQ